MNNYKTLLELVNSVPEYAKKATDNVYRNKVYVVGTLGNGHIESFCKTRKGAESYVNKQQTNSYYDDYSHEMVTCGSGLTIEEVSCFDIIDYLNEKRIWYKALKQCLSVPHFADNVVYNAKRYNVNPELLQWIEETAADLKATHGMIYIEEYEFSVEEIEEAQEEEQEERNTAPVMQEDHPQEETEQKDYANNNEVTITYNSELNGIEVRFTSKPSETVLDGLKANRFKWSKRGFWYAKQSDDTIAFANSLNGTKDDTERHNSNKTADPVYPQIDIDDLENYTVSDELQRRVHHSSLFEVDFKKECVSTFQSIQNAALEVIALTDNERIIYYIKKYLQSYKKRYYEQYLKILNHRANNPSWAVTGRGNLNARRYNKMQDRYSNMIGDSVALSNEFEKRMNKFKSEIADLKDKEFREKMHNSLNNVDQENAQFTISTKEVEGYGKKLRFYNYGAYSIVKSWGMFRIFKNGKEVKTTLKTTDTLETAKRYVMVLVQQDQEAV